MADTTKTPFAHAPASRLVGAYLIDLLVLGALVGVTWYVHFTAWTIGMITAEAVVASALMLGASGRTPGMALMRVCLIRDEEDAQTPSLGAALGYTALAVLLQVTGVGLLASYAMVHDGRTWLSGPTRTRFVDLRKHAALAAGPGEVERSERPSRAPVSIAFVRDPISGVSSPLRSRPHPPRCRTIPRPVSARTTPTGRITAPLQHRWSPRCPLHLPCRLRRACPLRRSCPLRLPLPLRLLRARPTSSTHSSRRPRARRTRAAPRPSVLRHRPCLPRLWCLRCPVCPPRRCLPLPRRFPVRPARERPLSRCPLSPPRPRTAQERSTRLPHPGYPALRRAAATCRLRSAPAPPSGVGPDSPSGVLPRRRRARSSCGSSSTPGSVSSSTCR